jgi:hypothetical protein
MQTYAFILDNVVTKVEACSEEDFIAQAHKYQNIADVTDQLPQPVVGWLLSEGKLVPPVELTQGEKDLAKYLKRARVKDQIIAEMASENIGRIRSGVWTVAQLTSLTQDQELKLVLDDVSTLSYELSVQKVMATTNALITPEIKAGWVAKLMSHFYN